MVEREEIMIVRKVYMANCLPNIGAMFPQCEEDEKVCIIIYCIFINIIYLLYCILFNKIYILYNNELFVYFIIKDILNYFFFSILYMSTFHMLKMNTCLNYHH